MSKNNERRKSGIFIVEGVQENERAIQFGYTLQNSLSVTIYSKEPSLLP